jgi:hypothetical protein
MPAKKIRIAPATTTSWATLPGNTADFMLDADMLDDTATRYFNMGFII